MFVLYMLNMSHRRPQVLVHAHLDQFRAKGHFNNIMCTRPELQYKLTGLVDFEDNVKKNKFTVAGMTIHLLILCLGHINGSCHTSKTPLKVKDSQ